MQSSSSRYDFNLLRVLDALLATGSVTAAAGKLHLSVPATSHALARLREAAADPLLVRAGRRLVPTPRAQSLREPVALWVAQASSLFAPQPLASLATLQREFTVRAPDSVAIAFGPAVVGALLATMPLARIHFVPESHGDAAALREGSVDLDIGHFQPKEPEVRQVKLFRQAQVAVVRKRHPLAARAVTARRYAAQPHVAVQRRPGTPSPVDEVLAALGLERRIVVTTAHANITPIIAARTNLVATVNERMAHVMAASLGLVVLALPFLSQPEPILMAWHPRHDADPAHRWLRESLQAAVNDVVAQRRPIT